MDILFYTKSNNRSPVYEFIKTLESKDKAKVLACLKNIEQLGLDSPRVQFRQIKGRLWEIKIRTSSGGYRFFFVTIRSNKLVMLHAYKKQSQKAPKKELDLAEKRMLEVLNESAYLK